MRARIAPLVALVTLALAGAVSPAAADECAFADQVVGGCRPAPLPDPGPQPPPQPQPLPQPLPPPEPQPEPETPQQQQQSFTPAHQPDAVARILVLMNGERRAHGLPQFTLRADVSAIAARHSEAMAAGGTIWHNDAYFTAEVKKRLGAALLGENVARNPEIDDAHRRLMNSPGHRANLLDRRFTVVGLAVYRSSTGSLYVTQNFVQPVAKAPEAPRAASPAPAVRKPAPTPPAAAPVPAPAPPAVGAAAPAAAIEAPLATDGVEVLAATPGLGGTPGSRSPVGGLVALATVALLAAVGVVAHRRRGLFAPLLARLGR